MQLIKSTGLLAWGLLLGLGSAAPAPADPVLTLLPTALPTSLPPILTKPGSGGSGGIPATCTSVVKGTTVGPKCHTHTTTLTSQGCRAPTGIACPMYIKVTTISVPCNTECCTAKPTKTVRKSCPTGCVIPTETVTVTTGCPVLTPFPVPTVPILTVPPVTWG
ncbi:hypothetical protein QBC47DRAFT_405455 [Echria macrotheca]|uniref:Uncharacterized protein n=1 Tax=Echria macrotheca TaxID=438768 RepID=A0AAJ0B659_9PEZI|nr:hypothetical protein QBC47DRAFT_405455 [Echria macrotheca]